MKFSERKSYNPLEMEAALCAWEQMLEWHGSAGADGSDARAKLSEFRQEFSQIWDQVGSAAMRSISIQAGYIAERVYALMERAGWEFHSCYDWEFVPAVLRRLDWAALCADNQYNGPEYRPRLAPILKEMLESAPKDFSGPVKPETKWLDEASRCATLQWGYEGLVNDHVERFKSMRKQGVSAHDAVKAVGEKYDLTPRSEWEGY